MLKEIEYIFAKNERNIELFHLLFSLFKTVKSTTNVETSQFHITPLNLYPKTVFKLSDINSNIQLNIGKTDYLNLLNTKSQNPKKLNKTEKLPIHEVASKLAGHIKRIDHTGINLPTTLFSELEWNHLLQYLTSVSNIYHYPTKQPWPFLLPVTEEEYQNDITHFDKLRDSKFELVYDRYTDIIGVHIEIYQNLKLKHYFPKIKEFILTVAIIELFI